MILHLVGSVGGIALSIYLILVGIRAATAPWKSTNEEES